MLLACGAAFAAPSAADLAREVRNPALDPDACYHVRDLSLFKEDLKLYFNEGYLIFSKPVNGERISAVFFGDVEGGDGEALLLPPYRGERLSLARFTQSPNLDEHFRDALLVFSDGSAQSLLDRITAGAGQAVPTAGPWLAAQWNATLANVQSGFDLRLTGDLLTPPSGRLGLLFAALAGKKLGNFEVFYDARSSNQIAVGRQAGPERHYAYDIWTGFPSRSHRSASAAPPESAVRDRSFQIDAALDPDLKLDATVRDTVETGPREIHALVFEVSSAVQVLSARVDGQPAELLLPDSARGSAVSDTPNVPFLVIPPSTLAPSTAHEIEIREQGSVISSAGNGVYLVAARSNWYPRSSGGLARYDLTFRYPSSLTLVTAGDVAEDRVDGDSRVTRRVTPVPIRFAGFNLGNYEKITRQTGGVRIDVYGNRGLELALQPRPEPVEPAPMRRPLRRGLPQHPDADAPPPPPNPLGRLEAVAEDVSSALQFFSGLFGPPPLASLTVSPVPGAFGQGFPGLVYLSTLSYLNPNQRPENARSSREQLFFSDLIEAHEVAHQWWGDVVIPEGYQDDWLAEALASYSALLYVERKQGLKVMEDVLEDYRDTLIDKDGKGSTVESAGPITWGFRLASTGGEAAEHDITYYKGAWVLHMLRQRLGDAQFFKMLAELRRRYDSRTVSTAQFAALVKDFAAPRSRGAMPFDVDAFFDNWVYGTGIPELKLSYSLKGSAPAIRISGSVGQSGVDAGFSAEIPVQIEFAKGPAQVIWVDTSNGETSFSALVRQTPLKVSIPCGRAVLAIKR